MKKNAFIRILCVVLCAVMFLGTCSMLPVYAAPEADSAPAQQADSAPGFFDKAVDTIFSNIGFLGFIYDPYQNTIINQKPVFQWALGFNDIYDLFPWAVNVWADTVKCEFNYGGKDWRIQLWKGGYGVFLATGGEIGIYNKPEGNSVEHYGAPASQSDWMNLKYTMYNKGKELFTRPSPYLIGDEGPYWWAPGYKVLSICSDFMFGPRTNVVMDATIELKDNAMAKLFIGELEKKGFKPLASGATMGLATPEAYRLMPDNRSVRLIWQNINEGWY